MNKEIKGLRMVITIVDRGEGSKVCKLFEMLGAHNHQTVLGYGTAPQDIYQYLGFGTIEKDIVISVVEETVASFMLRVLEVEMNFASPGHGVACSIPIQSIGGKRALEAVLSRNKEE